MPLFSCSFLSQIRQFEFATKMQIGLSALHGLGLASWPPKTVLRPSADDVGVRNDP